MKFYKYIFIYLLLFPLFTQAQSGPAGVGNSSNNVLWLKADSGTSTNINGQSINIWNDLSGNDNHISQNIVAQQPLFQSNILNGYPAIAFDFNNTAGQNDFMFAPDSPTLDNTTGLTIFTVVRPTASGSARSIIGKRVNVGVDQSYMLFFFSSDQLYADIVSNNDRFSTPISYAPNNNYLITMHYNGSLTSANRVKIYTNESLTSTASETSSNIPDFNSPLVIGATHVGDNRAFGGYMAEIIVYRSALNNTQRIIVNNYLSAKYNIPLTVNNIYTMDNSLNGDYDHEVAGIGRISATDQHTNAKGAGIVNILNPRNLGNNEFLVWGHNNLPQQAYNSTDIPPNLDARFERVWRVSEVNLSNVSIDVGNIDIRWDLSGFNTVASSDLRLLIDTDNDGLFADETPIGGANMISSGIYQFSNVAALSNNRRFTLGTINAIQTPLPIILTSFELTQVNKQEVKIEWTTSSEVNNDYFEIQKSKDLVLWDEVKKIKGAGNSTTPIYYNVIDYPLYDGRIYYRLKQIDFNGEYEFFKVKSIFLKKENNSNNVSIYPNPANDHVFIQLDNTFKKIRNTDILIFDSNGKDVSEHVTMNFLNETMLLLNTSNLKSGTYFIRTISYSNMFSIK